MQTRKQGGCAHGMRAFSRKIWIVCLSVLALAGAPLVSTAQTSSGSITGTVQDKSGAVIPNADVTLVNVQTEDQRKTQSNGSGIFFFAAVPVGSYKVTISASGFATFTATDIVMHSGESHVIPDIQLPVLQANTNVEVTASQAAVIPLDNGASSTTLNEVLVDKLEIQGRDAAELVKFMPAMAMNTGLGQTSFSSLTTSTNSGPIGQFSSAGTQPYGSMQMTLDGASLVDVGNQGTQIANVNQDSTKEFTFLNAAFGADTPRGPTVIQITSKSGGQSFHGDAYVYARNWQANANDAYFRENNQARPAEHQTYVGGTVGGPVIVPHFNKNRDKLFFFAAYEKMFQNPFPTLHKTVTPTTDWINGNFSADTMKPFFLADGSNSWWPTLQVPCANAPNWTSYCPVGGANPLPGGQISTGQMDPDGKALLSYLNKINPPNVDPSTHDGYNFYYLDNSPVNRWEARGRGDYDPTENDKISVVYTKQNEADINKFCVWWCPGDTGLSPSPLNATTKADLWTVNYTRVIGTSMTNELSFFRTYFTFPPAFTDPSAMNVSAAGYTTSAPFGVPSAQAFEQLPSMVSWGCSISGSAGCFDGIYVPAMMKDFNNAFGNIKKIYAVQDNFTKILGRHSLKAGIFWDRNNQVQTTSYGNWTQGLLDFEQYATYTTNNPYADMLLGHTDGMSQVSNAPTHDMAYYEYAFYGQDQWRVTNKLTLDLGIRVEHEGNWAPVSGLAEKSGIAVWNPALYDNSSSAPAWTGMEWHGENSKIPLSGFTSKLFYPDPRVGFAYDTHGNGKIVVRGGVGLYRWQFSEGDIDSGLSPGLNVSSITTPSTTSFAQLASFAPGSSSWCAENYTCPSVQVMKNEDKTPYTLNWDAMVDTELPGHMVFELQYIGNATRNALLGGNGSTAYFYSNINKIPLGGLYGTDTLDNTNHWETSCAAGPCTIPASNYYGGYVPYKNYSTLYLIQHGSYSNYNGMVAALQKQSGRQTFIINYTFSKVMGIRDGQTDNGTGDGAVVNGFDLRSNYGPLNYDHTHIFNAAYYLSIPGFKNYGEIVKAITNGWALSGTYQFQSGAPIQSNTGGNLNANWNTGTADPATMPNNGNAASAAYLLGTNGENLTPYLTCDPRNGGGRYFNAGCFQTPSIMGKNGPVVWPYIKGPAYQDADLTAARTFKVIKEQTLEFRASAFNFLNHPLPELGDGSDVKLSMSCEGPVGVAGCPAGGTNTNTVTNGDAAYHRGRRVIEATLKYYF